MKKTKLNKRVLSIATAFLMSLILVFSGTTFAYASIEPLDEKDNIVVIKNANVIDVKTGDVNKNKDITIENNKITKISNSDDNYKPAKAKIFDAKNQYVIPGLWDMHTHLLKTHENAFPLLLNNGITGVRDMGTPLDGIDMWKEYKQSGKDIPRIVHAGQTLQQMADGKVVPPHMRDLHTEEEAREAVHEMYLKGADHMKIYSGLPNNLVKVILDECKKYNIVAGGHIPYNMTYQEASNLGMKSIEHLWGANLSMSSFGDDILKDPKMKDEMFSFYKEIESLNYYDENCTQELIDTLKKNKTWIVPTLVASQYMASKKVNLEDLQYVPTQYQKQWPENIKHFTDLNVVKLYDKFLPPTMKTVKKFSDAGVLMLAGSDSTFELPNQIYGVSLQKELKLLNESGMSTLKVLQSATLNPSKYLNRENELGTVEEGKLADLVILKGNPLENIDNTKNISAVILNGKLMPKDSIENSVKTYDITKN